MKFFIIGFLALIAYAMYLQAVNGQDIFTMFWSLASKFVGG